MAYPYNPFVPYGIYGIYGGPSVAVRHRGCYEHPARTPPSPVQWLPLRPHIPYSFKHPRRARRTRKEAQKYGLPLTKEQLEAKDKAEHEIQCRALEKEGTRRLKVMIEKLHRLQKPTHLRVWDGFGHSYLLPKNHVAIRRKFPQYSTDS